MLRAALLSLAARVEALETRQRKLVDTALSMRKAMEVWDAEVARMNVRLTALFIPIADVIFRSGSPTFFSTSKTDSTSISLPNLKQTLLCTRLQQQGTD